MSFDGPAPVLVALRYRPQRSDEVSEDNFGRWVLVVCCRRRLSVQRTGWNGDG